MKGDGAAAKFIRRHPVVANLAIIAVVAFLGILIVSLSLAIFTKHGRHQTVPGVENMSYTEAIETLTDKGLRVEIRDSIYHEEMKPGYVIEQFPKRGSVVKPGRKIFLYINTVHPKEVVIDDTDRPGENAMRNISSRQGIARLEELGFKNIRIIKVLGETDRIVRVTANGRVVKTMMKVPVTARIVVEVSDGRLSELRDSLQLEEMRLNGTYPEYAPEEEYPAGYEEYPAPAETEYSSPVQEEEEEPEFLQ